MSERSSETAAEADDPAGATCLACGYSLQSLASARCPECGLAFDPAAHASVIPWERRAVMGSAKAWWATDLLVFFGWKRFRTALAQPLRLDDALRYPGLRWQRRVTAVLAGGLCLGLGVSTPGWDFWQGLVLAVPVACGVFAWEYAAGYLPALVFGLRSEPRTVSAKAMWYYCTSAGTTLTEIGLLVAALAIWRAGNVWAVPAEGVLLAAVGLVCLMWAPMRIARLYVESRAGGALRWIGGFALGVLALMTALGIGALVAAQLAIIGIAIYSMLG